MAKAKSTITAPTKEKTKIRFLRHPSGAPFFLAYRIGDVVELNPKLAKELIDAGMATKE